MRYMFIISDIVTATIAPFFLDSSSGLFGRTNGRRQSGNYVIRQRLCIYNNSRLLWKDITYSVVPYTYPECKI
jgi:hypothetical protein